MIQENVLVCPIATNTITITDNISICLLFDAALNLLFWVLCIFISWKNIVPHWHYCYNRILIRARVAQWGR